MSEIWLIIKREYWTRVRKKTFIIMSFLGPILIVSFIGLTAYLSNEKKDGYEIIVFDEANLFNGVLRNNKKYHLKWAPKDKKYNQVQEIFKADDDLDLLLYLPSNLIKTNSMTAKCLYKAIPSSSAQKHLTSIINEAIELYRVNENQIDIETYRAIKTRVNLDIIDIEDPENKNIQRKGIVGFIFAFFIYFFILMYSVQVMRGVIEEKTSRIIEIIISSVSSFKLMIAKIIGVGLVGFTQFFIWILVITVTSVLLLHNLVPDIYSSTLQSQNPVTVNVGESAQIIEFLLYQIHWPSMFIFFGVYFIGGYLLYAGMMAAIGAAVDEETDTQQFLIPLTLPMIFALSMISSVIDDPSSSLSFWLSEIPFTSPVIMLVRIAMGIGPSSVEVWEIMLSVGLLFATFILTTWLSSKIYANGVLSFGKKASYKELFKWLKS
ncbi:MAG: ABC transporter permease [Bacteroidota bacterium]|nr:ABC transporter permease [Bacteroidota bacterium]